MLIHQHNSLMYLQHTSSGSHAPKKLVAFGTIFFWANATAEALLASEPAIRIHLGFNATHAKPLVCLFLFIFLRCFFFFFDKMMFFVSVDIVFF